MVDNFVEIMDMLDTSSSVGIFRFFLTYGEDLKQTPVDAIKEGTPGQLEMIKVFAAQFNRQIAR